MLSKTFSYFVDASGNLVAPNLSGTNTGDITLASIGSSPANAGASLSSQVLTLQPCDATHGGVIANATQTIPGAKTMGSALTIASGTGLKGAASGASDLGDTSTYFGNVYTTAVKGAAGTTRLAIPSSDSTTVTGTVADGGTAVAVITDNTVTLSTAGAKLLSVRNNTTEKASINKDGGATFASDVQINTGVLKTGTSSSPSLTHRGNCADGAGNIANFFSNTTSLTTATAKIASFSSTSATGGEKLAILASGKVSMDATDSSGTPGAATINKPSGQVAVASGVSSVTVTNSLVATTSVVLAVLQDNTDAVEIRSVVPSSGSFVINLTGNTSAARKCGFVVFN